MAGIFSKSNRPKRPGAYFNWQPTAQAPVYEGSAGVVAIPLSANWGPANTVVSCNSLGDFLAVFGRAQTATTGYAAVKQAFQGEGLPGISGADRVLAYRMVNAGAVKASVVLQKTGAAPAVTLTARYYGTYGNRLSAESVADSVDPTNTANLVIYDNGVEIERFKYAKTDITALAAAINAQSSWVTAGSVTSGTILIIDGTHALTAGTNGTTANGDYTAALTAFALQRFSHFAFDDMDGNDSTRAGNVATLAALTTWVADENARGHRFTAIVGGTADETLATAQSRTTSLAVLSGAGNLAAPNMVNIGVGSVTDVDLGTLSPAKLAPRIAGILARRGEKQNLTFARLAGTTIINGASTSEILSSISTGVVVLARDSHPLSPTRIEKGVTAFTSTVDTNRPFATFSSPKYLRVMQAFEMEMTEYAEFNLIGRGQVTQSTRDALCTQAQIALKRREADGIVQPGWTATIDNDPPPAATDEYIALAVAIAFGRSLEQVYYTVTAG